MFEIWKAPKCCLPLDRANWKPSKSDGWLVTCFLLFCVCVCVLKNEICMLWMNIMFMSVMSSVEFHKIHWNHAAPLNRPRVGLCVCVLVWTECYDAMSLLSLSLKCARFNLALKPLSVINFCAVVLSSLLFHSTTSSIIDHSFNSSSIYNFQFFSIDFQSNFY